MDPYIFNLDAPIESLSDVPSDLQGMFEQTENGYVVAEASKPIATRLNGLAQNLTETRNARTQAGRDAGAAREMANAFKAIFDGVDGVEEVTPENVQAYMKDLQAKAAKGGKAGDDAAAQIQAIKDQMAKSHATEIASVQEQLAAKDATIEKLVVGSQVSDAVAKHEVVGGEVFKAFLMNRVQVQDGEDGIPVAIVMAEDGKTPVYNGTGSPMSVDEYVGSLRTKDDFAAFFKSPKKSGDGTNPRQSSGPGRRASQGERSPAEKISAGLQRMKSSRGLG